MLGIRVVGALHQLLQVSPEHVLTFHSPAAFFQKDRPRRKLGGAGGRSQKEKLLMGTEGSEWGEFRESWWPECYLRQLLEPSY